MDMTAECVIQNRKHVLSIASLEKPSYTCPYFFIPYL